MPAYEWNFGDVNPPVHAWSTIFTFLAEKGRHGKGDLAWLERCFHKLLLNFTWWVNRKDRTGNNVFEGGFLGLDNIGVFDRSAPLPTGGYLEQADGTAWMVLFCQNMIEIGAELALENPAYLDLTIGFLGHFLRIASAMIRPGDETGMWDEEDGFFYDVLRYPDGRAERLKVSSMVGVLPFCAVTLFEGTLQSKYPELLPRLREYSRRAARAQGVHPRPGEARAQGPPSRIGAERGEPAPGAESPARRNRVSEPVRDSSRFPRSPGAPVRLPGRRQRVPGAVCPRGIGQRHVRRQLELARANLDAGQHGGRPRLAPVLRCTTATRSSSSARRDRGGQ